MKQQLHSSSYQQLGARKKLDKVVDSTKKQNLTNQGNSTNFQQGFIQGLGVDSAAHLINLNQQQQYNFNPNLQIQGRAFNKNGVQSGMSLEQLISNQTNQLQLNYLSQQRCQTQPQTTPISQTAQKNQKSRSPSYKSGSQIKLQSAQLENIQKQFNKLLEKENKQMNNSNSNNSANKSFLQQQQQQSAQLAGGGSVTYLNQTKSNAIQRRQRNLTQLNINTNNTNNSMNKGTSTSLTRINRSLTPNSRNNSANLHGQKGDFSSNLMQFQSGNQTTANISQKHYDFNIKLDPQQQQKPVSKSSKQMNQSIVTHQQQQMLQKSQLQKNSLMFNNSQQSNASVNGEVINNRLASVIQKNPQSIEEYSIKDKQLNKLLQQLLQQRMKQQQQIQQFQQSNNQTGSKNLESSISPTMSLMSSKPSTLQSYYAHLGLNNNAKNSLYQANNNTNSLQGYSFLNNSTQAGSSTQNLTNGNQTLTSNQYNSNNPHQQQQHQQLNPNQSSLSLQLQARNLETNSVFQEQLKVEEQFQLRYQQYKDKFSTYQSDSQNNSKMVGPKDNYYQTAEQKHTEESVTLAESVQGSAPNLLKIQNQLMIIDEDSKSQQQEEDTKEKDLNSNGGIESQYQSNGYTYPQSMNNPKELIAPDDEPLSSNYQTHHHHNPQHLHPHQGSNMGPMTINTETDSVQLMSAKERENMMQYIENAQFPHGSTTYQDLIQNVPNDIHQEIIIIYEEKIKEITEKFQHRDVILRQSLMKLEKENSILLSKVQEQQEEIFRYKKLRDMETKLIKKLEGEIKMEKMKYQKLFQQKVYKKGNDKGFNSQLVEELNKKINDMQQEKECLEYLLKDALLKTELLKAKESVIYRQVPFSNNLNTSTSTISLGGNQTGSNNMNQLFQYLTNSNSNFNYPNVPAQQAEIVNLLSLDNSLNKSHSLHQQQQQQQQPQLQQIQHLITLTSDHDQSPDNNFLRMRNRSYGDSQYFGQNHVAYPQELDNTHIQNQTGMQVFDHNHQHQQKLIQAQNEQYHNQMNQFNKEVDPESSERSNFMKAYKTQSSNNNNEQNDQMSSSPSYPSNYVLRKSNSNQINSQQNQQEDGQNSEMKMGSYLMRSSSQNQHMLPEDYYYSENDQHDDYEQQQQMELHSHENQQHEQNPYYQNNQHNQNQQKHPIYFEINQQDNIQNYEFNNTNYMMNHHFQDIRNSQQIQNSQQMLEIRSPSNSQGNNTTPMNINCSNNMNNYNNNDTNNINQLNEIHMLERNEKSANKSYLINNSQVIQEEASSAGNTTQNNDNNQNGSSTSQNYSIKLKHSSNNLDSSSAVIEVNVNENNVNHDIFQKSDNSKIFVDNETLSKSDNLEQDEEIEAEFKDISESNRRRQKFSQDKINTDHTHQPSVYNEHEVQSLTEEYLKNKVEILNNASFQTNNINQQNVTNCTPQLVNEVIQETQPKDEDDEAIIKYYNTKNLYLQKYYASQNNSSGVNSKSQNSSNVPPQSQSEKNDKVNINSNNN